ncbi:helix-turn-helix transcriptional regulator [Nocardioides humilatus]|uniref:Helix-turn-helix transcriptional regulator n=1 Tax=Nocardioides humilatus TaxID=2607660 RepID=A0A5B1LN06_9ACTN|nr:helix-turn-helix transcriptional regulator [Nocardioides humilatus]KAA1421933.1 helix-turn-helix transcriptional regulator [Nocardioides humilatus]
MGQKEHASEPINVAAIHLVRAAFAEASMTQHQLSEASGIPRSTLANMLSPTAEPRLVHVSQLVRIAIALGIDTRDWAAHLEAFERKRRGGDLDQRRGRKAAAPAVQKRAARKPSAGK